MQDQKPHITEVLEIMMLKEEAKMIYQEIDERVEKLKSKFGEQRFDYDLEELPMCEFSTHLFAHEKKQAGQFIKFEIIDNALKLQFGESVFTTASIKPITFNSGSLKRCPQSLKTKKPKVTEENYCENCMGNGWVNVPPFKGSETIVQTDCSVCKGTKIDPNRTR